MRGGASAVCAFAFARRTCGTDAEKFRDPVHPRTRFGRKQEVAGPDLRSAGSPGPCFLYGLSGVGAAEAVAVAPGTATERAVGGARVVRRHPQPPLTAQAAYPFGGIRVASWSKESQ
ncbi:hypothetical protein GCM10010449_42420 [Streptomyces rectiviolaceus]|uniref:Uncharacterized protein n=1 Tax=Streptomyces rectiviolaceus TaxID=332591 RepID=A0ABP6MKW8_9ACTN